MSLFSFCLSWFQTIEIQVVPTHSSSELSSVATDGGKIQQSGLRKHERSGPGGGPGSFSHRVKNICSWGSSHRVKNICSSLCPLAWLSHFPNACFSFYHSVTQPPWFFFFCLFVFFLSYFYICLSTGKKRKAQPKSWELCFIWQTYQGLKPGCSLSGSFEGLFWRDKGGVRMYRSFCNKNKVVEKAKGCCCC